MPSAFDFCIPTRLTSVRIQTPAPPPKRLPTAGHLVPFLFRYPDVVGRFLLPSLFDDRIAAKPKNTVPPTHCRVIAVTNSGDVAAMPPALTKEAKGEQQAKAAPDYK